MGRCDVVWPRPQRDRKKHVVPQLPEQGVRCAAVVAVGMRRWVGGTSTMRQTN